MIDIRYVPADSTQIAMVFRSLLEDGADLLLTAGGNTIDPLDPIEQALPLIDARLIHRGAPTRGSMFWLAQLGDVPIINLASCRMYIGTALADLILPMYMAGEQVTPDDIMALGYGGLPGSAIGLRFPPYDDDLREEMNLLRVSFLLDVLGDRLRKRLLHASQHRLGH